MIMVLNVRFSLSMSDFSSPMSDFLFQKSAIMEVFLNKIYLSIILSLLFPLIQVNTYQSLKRMLCLESLYTFQTLSPHVILQLHYLLFPLSFNSPYSNIAIKLLSLSSQSCIVSGIFLIVMFSAKSK